MTRIPPGVEIEAVTYVRVGRAEGGPCEGERVLEVRVRLSDGTTAACHWMCDDLTAHMLVVDDDGAPVRSALN